MNIASIEKYDLEKMYKIYDKWPDIARESFETEQKTIDIVNVDHIVFAGMGGSGALSDLTRYFPMKPAPPVTKTFIKISDKVRLYLILITISF